MSFIRFRGRIEIIGINPYVHITKALAEQIKPGWNKPIPVLVHINGKAGTPWRINLMPMGNGDFYLYLHGDIRKATQTQVGDDVEVEIAFDAEYKNGPMQPIPEWFQMELDKNPAARKNWDALPPSKRKEIVRYFSGLKSDDAKERNCKKAISVLSGEDGRFMAREWRNGRPKI